MKLLLDTHILLWSAYAPRRLSRRACRYLEDTANELYFSVVSLWEISVKRGLNRTDFQYEPRVLRQTLVKDRYHELPVTAEHVFSVEQLPRLHKDPFDRMLLCQALVEGLTVFTDDELLTRYPQSVLRA